MPSLLHNGIQQHAACFHLKIVLTLILIDNVGAESFILKRIPGTAHNIPEIGHALGEALGSFLIKSGFLVRCRRPGKLHRVRNEVTLARRFQRIQLLNRFFVDGIVTVIAVLAAIAVTLAVAVVAISIAAVVTITVIAVTVITVVTIALAVPLAVPLAVALVSVVAIISLAIAVVTVSVVAVVAVVAFILAVTITVTAGLIAFVVVLVLAFVRAVSVALTAAVVLALPVTGIRNRCWNRLRDRRRVWLRDRKLLIAARKNREQIFIQEAPYIVGKLIETRAGVLIHRRLRIRLARLESRGQQSQQQCGHERFI